LGTATTTNLQIDERAAARKSFLLVFLCTLIGALGQMLIKTGAGQLGVHVNLSEVLRKPSVIFTYAFGILANPRLFLGYVLYGVNTFLMAAALKGRELSRLFPVIALTYVWVTFLSISLLGERMNWYRAAGIALIVTGVSVLGMKSRTEVAE
jgi:drug/metabolite transporter (DMT)-like permease